MTLTQDEIPNPINNKLQLHTPPNLHLVRSDRSLSNVPGPNKREQEMGKYNYG